MKIDKYIVNNDVLNFTRCDQIYFNSNERLNDIFDKFNFKDKRIFSVLGSGDQAFHLINRGARKIDLFDCNNIAFYYFYLRIWMIKYFDMFYYSNHLNSTFIKNLICKVKPANNNENNALYFWQKIIKMNIFDEYEDSIFVRNSICMANNKIDDLKKLKYYLKHNKFNFHNIDISGEISVDRKYDYLILSNIAEWLSSSDYNNIWQFCRNVDQLLKDDGIAICSKLWNDDNDKRVKDILKRLFSINNLNDSTNYLPGYYLVKK